MRVLVVYCHPVPESFCAAIRDTVLATLARAGHEAQLIDLYAEGFDPVMSTDERRVYNDGPPSDPTVLAHAGHLQWADALLFVYPTWWYGQPAMLKGWLERVFAVDIAFALTATGSTRSKLQHIRRLGVVTTCGAPGWWSHLVGHPGRKTLLRGIRALCALNCRTMFLAHYRMDASTDATRRAFLAQVEKRLARF